MINRVGHQGGTPVSIVISQGCVASTVLPSPLLSFTVPTFTALKFAVLPFRKPTFGKRKTISHETSIQMSNVPRLASLDK